MRALRPALTALKTAATLTRGAVLWLGPHRPHRTTAHKHLTITPGLAITTTLATDPDDPDQRTLTVTATDATIALTYNTTDPYAATLTVTYAETVATATFARDLLAHTILTGHAGEHHAAAAFHATRHTNPEGADVLALNLTTDHGPITVVLPTQPARTATHAWYRAVAPGHEHVDLTALEAHLANHT